MQESTPTGDSASLTVDQAAEALLSRYDEAESNESTEEPRESLEAIEAETTETEAELESDADVTEISEETDANADEAEASFSTINELAEATGMEVDDFMKSINLTTKVNGEEKEVNLADLKKGYQLESDYTKKNEAFLSEQKEWAAQHEASQTKLNQELERTGHAFRLAQEQLTHEFNAINWKQLEADDPSGYLLQRQKFGERQAQVDQAINNATQHANQIVQQQKAEKAEKDAKYLQDQDALLLSAIPSWSDQTVRSKEAKKVAEFLSQNGFTHDEVSNLKDHRVILMARKAMTGDKAVTDVDIAKKKVKSVPKLVKPNARQNVNQNTQRINKQQAAFKKSGKVDDLAKLLIARG